MRPLRARLVQVPKLSMGLCRLPHSQQLGFERTRVQVPAAQQQPSTIAVGGGSFLPSLSRCKKGELQEEGEGEFGEGCGERCVECECGEVCGV